MFRAALPPSNGSLINCGGPDNCQQQITVWLCAGPLYNTNQCVNNNRFVTCCGHNIGTGAVSAFSCGGSALNQKSGHENNRVACAAPGKPPLPVDVGPKEEALGKGDGEVSPDSQKPTEKRSDKLQ